MSRVVRACNGTQAAVFGAIEKVAKVERQRLFGPEPEPMEMQLARYQASEEARRVIAEAFELAESIREDAQRSGFNNGWAEGYAAGKSAAEAEVYAEAERFRAEYRADFAQLLARIEEERQALWLDAEPQMIAFVTEMARKVVKHEVAINPDIIVEVVRNALRRVVDGENVRIRVNAADLEQVRAAREDIMTVIDGVRTVEIIEDRRVTQGGCVVETASGTIDARVETQFRTIEETLHVVREEVVAELQSGGVAECESEGVAELQSEGLAA